ncbi:Hydrogenobyrinate a,c-diamide synthase [Candidatus Hodgkinia cicadicola]|nr:Hydrogenobyrinate a,c-diamide synthase [Candidatus Hodgkinia cicadicola]
MLVISSIRSNDGKTAVTCGLASVFCKLGLDFELAKIGPDYLDSLCAGNYANVNRINLVSQCGKQFYRWLSWLKRCSLVEDCMGVMDSSEGEKVTTAALFHSLGGKLVLVLNCESAMQTTAYISSIICSKLSGIILNNISSYKQEIIISKTINRVAGVPILGILRPRAAALGRRHLGVIQPSEVLESLDEVYNLTLEMYYSCNISKLAQLMLAGDN